jgi:hypothetical protein
MFDQLFHRWFEQIAADRFQEGCRDRDAGRLPRMPDSIYLNGYLSNRPEGLDGIVQYFPSVEAYFQWKLRSLRT